MRMVSAIVLVIPMAVEELVRLLLVILALRVLRDNVLLVVFRIVTMACAIPQIILI